MALSAAEQKELDRVNEEEYQKTLKLNPNAKRKVEAVDEGSTPGTVDAKIEPAKSTTKNETPKKHPEEDEKKDEKKETPVVSSVAQLRDLAQSTGTTVSTEQVEAARKAEEDAATELSKVTRVSAANQK